MHSDMTLAHDANERSEGGCTCGARSSGAAESLKRLTMSVVMPGRHMRARTAAQGAVIVRNDQSSNASNGRNGGTLSTKPRPFRLHVETRSQRCTEIEAHTSPHDPRNGHHNDQTTAGRLEHALEIHSWTLSTLAMIIHILQHERSICFHSRLVSHSHVTLALARQ